MKVGVLCEFSGVVRDAFTRKGHYSVSCDLLPTESPGNHIEGNCFDVDWSKFDLLICHPPCTHLCVSGARWFKKKQNKQKQALTFIRKLMSLPVNRIVIENPVGVISTKIRRPEQIIQPWQYGHGETKKTCLWLKNLPLLVPTQIVAGRENRIHRLGPSKDRGKLRSIFYKGIADAMASQWGSL